MIQRKNCVLIVEDELELRENLSARLEKAGYKTLGCVSVTEAIKLCENQRFDCIIVDYQLARGTGEQLIMQTRKNQFCLNNKTPFLLISGHLDLFIFKSVKDQIQGALVKPFDPNTFLDKVKAICPVDDPFGEGLDGN